MCSKDCFLVLAEMKVNKNYDQHLQIQMLYTYISSYASIQMENCFFEHFNVISQIYMKIRRGRENDR